MVTTDALAGAAAQIVVSSGARAHTRTHREEKRRLGGEEGTAAPSTLTLASPSAFSDGSSGLFGSSAMRSPLTSLSGAPRSLLAALCFAAAVAAAAPLVDPLRAAALACPSPPPAANFSFAALAGRWHEVGKYQTFNPFEAGCSCTTVDFVSGKRARTHDHGQTCSDTRVCVSCACDSAA